MKTLDKYIKENHERGIIDHALRANVDENGRITFYIHPANAEGDTLDYELNDEMLYSRQCEECGGLDCEKHTSV